jgi:hypothetical protein
MFGIDYVFIKSPGQSQSEGVKPIFRYFFGAHKAGDDGRHEKVMKNRFDPFLS